jgi:cytochrome b561
LAIWIHSAFYFLLFAIAISGIATMILGGYGDAISTEDPSLILNHEDILPLKAHGTLAVITLVLLVMHIGGVIKHYISYKENTLRRIF